MDPILKKMKYLLDENGKPSLIFNSYHTKTQCLHFLGE